ncbi:MAG TPA: HypC/HybG/HupF family hydrogenase formation chaperone [Bacillota bacterium]|nr:HypC/HybG/HupF family hydrogenase formation chaperone [Bacillota bacterium]
MCLAVPGRLINVAGTEGEVETLGVTKKVSLLLTPEAKAGEYVLVHAGFAIQVIDESLARETLALLREMDELEPPAGI